MHGHLRWWLLGIGSAFIGPVRVAASLLFPVVFGRQGRDAGGAASLFFGFMLYGWLLASAITAP